MLKITLQFVSILLFVFAMSGCLQPVCCGSQPEYYPTKLKLSETHKRQGLVDLLLDYQSQRAFNKVTNLFAQDIKDKINRSRSSNIKRSDEALARYIEDMKKFIFVNEKLTTHKNKPMWALSYQHFERKSQFIVYYFVKEDHEYKIFSQRFLNSSSINHS